MNTQSLQITLAILKPDITRVPFFLKAVRNGVLSSGFLIVRSQTKHLRRAEAEKFYHEHRDRFFYNRLVSFMSSGPVHAHILAHNSAIKLWRDLMGPTKTFVAQYQAPTSLRGLFGLTDTRNSMHGSDSVTSALKEISFFFPTFSHSEWLRLDEPLLRQGKYKFDLNSFCHKPYYKSKKFILH